MPSITTVHESLPSQTSTPTSTQLTAAQTLITRERTLHPDDPNHALPPLPPPIPHPSPHIRILPPLQYLPPPKLNALDLS
ncbi:hypothetical protein QC764_201910 [Podospora pseudoanserina]|uniref:Uncharacterized protein n=1 Tax=Podospora pseudoanserina TaxID=2609844 RepID=A0ABR0IFK7_9PEZI|nr:hypothetical protein QC764_201910 [Podospora pseudoanserina]